MTQTELPASGIPSPTAQLVPLPYALYDSNGLLFELYDGGQRSKPHHIQWTRLEPNHVADLPRPSE